MKQFIIILLALLPGIVMAKGDLTKSYSFKYDKVYVAQTGDDNFSTDRVITQNRSGDISISHLHININGEDFDLKPWKAANMYRSKGYLFKFAYTKAGLKYVEQFRYDKVYWYCVHQNTDPATSVAVTQ